MTDEHPPEKMRSRRVYVLWSAALASLLAVSLFCWVFLRPYLITRTITAEYGAYARELQPNGIPGDAYTKQLRRFAEPRIARLGGAERAAGRLALYLKLPPSWAPERSAAVALCSFCGPPGAPVLGRALAEEDPMVRLVAVVALGTMGPQAESAIPELTAALRGDMCELAAIALGRIGPAAREAVPAMLAALANKSGWDRCAIMAAVSQLTGPEKFASQFRAEGVYSYSDLPRRLLKALTKDKDPKIRRAAADALTRYASDAVPEFIEHLRGLNPEIRSGYATALGNIGPAARAAVPELTRLLGDSNQKVRQSAAEALGKFGAAAEPAIPSLTKLLKDKSEIVREVAAEALKKIKAAQEKK